MNKNVPKPQRPDTSTGKAVDIDTDTTVIRLLCLVLSLHFAKPRTPARVDISGPQPSLATQITNCFILTHTTAK